MNVQALIAKCEKIEFDGNYAPDMRIVVQGERFALIAAARSGDGAKIKAASAEAVRVLRMWGIEMDGAGGGVRVPDLTTIETLSDSQIRDLQREASEAGDRARARVFLCRVACGDEETATQTEIKAARIACLDVIRLAEANAADRGAS